MAWELIIQSPSTERTDAAVLMDVKGFYILLSIESKQMRLYVNHAFNVTDK